MTSTLTPPRQRPGRHVLLDVGFVISQLGAFLSGLVIWFFSGLTFFGEPLDRADYLHMATGFGVTAALLVLSVVIALVVGARLWVTLVGVILASLSGVFAVLSLVEAHARPAEPMYGQAWWWALEPFVLPTTWPLLIVYVGMPIMAAAARRQREETLTR